MQLMVKADDPPIYRELAEQWNRRQREVATEPEPELAQPSSRWSRIYRHVTDWLKGPEARPEKAAYRPHHRRIAHA